DGADGCSRLDPADDRDNWIGRTVDEQRRPREVVALVERVALAQRDDVAIYREVHVRVWQERRVQCEQLAEGRVGELPRQPGRHDATYPGELLAADTDRGLDGIALGNFGEESPDEKMAL